jgi:hypothetical protein
LDTVGGLLNYRHRATKVKITEGKDLTLFGKIDLRASQGVVFQVKEENCDLDRASGHMVDFMARESALELKCESFILDRGDWRPGYPRLYLFINSI